VNGDDDIVEVSVTRETVEEGATPVVVRATDKRRKESA